MTLVRVIRLRISEATPNVGEGWVPGFIPESSYLHVNILQQPGALSGTSPRTVFMGPL